jgi:L-serine deaminase
MNDERSTPPSKKSLDERFSKHPHMYEQMQRVADMMEQAIANGATADEAEAMAIKQINDLGRALLTDWAKAKHDRSVDEIKREVPSTIRNSKKN